MTAEPFEVRYSYDESPHGMLATFPTFDEAVEFANFVRDEINPLVGGWVEFDDIGQFALAMELAAEAGAPRRVPAEELAEINTNIQAVWDVG